ncbi:SMI1/KNR4 family protein [Streptomyces niveiscabiei]|uniref:SMI1/KNR4 family protein n=1 Tax=Streptomyces TaxID=1883 RepID=UPI0010579710|nr:MULTISPECIES: SMI1/KNR4 family protein [Streptomyces]
MDWVERIASAVSWESRDISIDWGDAERQLGAELPEDFKRFCSCFGAGKFSDYLEVYSSSASGAFEVVEVLKDFHQISNEHPVVRKMYEPYGLFTPDRGGLIPWGVSETAVEYYWIGLSGGRPEGWNVGVRERGGDLREYEMGMSEFVYGMLTDVNFGGFGIAELVPEPFYVPRY